MALALMTLGVFVLPAAAEGSFTSSFTDWLPGSSSRTWADRNVDGTSTQITLGGCRRKANPTLRVVLRIQLTEVTPWYEPDQSMGRKDFDCHDAKRTKYWGDLPKGSYRFSLTHVNGSNPAPDRVHASYVKVVY